MKIRMPINLLLCVLCVGAVWGIHSQRQRITVLRDEYRRLEAESRPAAKPFGRSPSAAFDSSPPPELLRLRGEVTALMRRQDELAGVRSENRQLQRLQPASAPPAPDLPPLPDDYVLRRDVQFRGYTTPEAAAESMMWALVNRNVQIYLQTLTPEAAHDFDQTAQSSQDYVSHCLQGADELPGFRIEGKELLEDGSVVVFLQCVPGLDSKLPLILRPVNGQWKVHQNFFEMLQ
jgi:hypothetical protein